MDWFLRADEASAVGDLRREVVAYLRRHGGPGSEVEDAGLALSEVVGNAVRHSGGPVWVSLSWTQEQPVLTVRDLGPGFDPARLGQPVTLAPPGATPTLAEAGLGLFLVSQVTPSLAAEVRRAGGMTVSVTLPVNRVPAVSHDPPRSTVGALPELDEALPGGGFGKESFLRALVVQLARAVEAQQGPDAAAAAVAQVGADIGGRMEEEYRAARSVVGRLTPEQMADCYVRLKHAIDGGFYVIEVTEHRIVLGNTRCPFGDVVQRAPSLCRMTSSVFGGIAARNSDHTVAVLLEERIAVGDPGCRVVVDLDAPPEGGRPLAHEYAAVAEATLFPG
ncbi:ATP-binding protein [Oryzihumus sp.]|uniref:ATP-binding protein n=1 Tax=Oryzihumus sp. TaxID=1968903 RepID=UPI002ED9D65B